MGQNRRNKRTKTASYVGLSPRAQSIYTKTLDKLKKEHKLIQEKRSEFRRSLRAQRSQRLSPRAKKSTRRQTGLLARFSRRARSKF